MSPTAMSWIAFACIFGGTLLGMFFRKILPEHHLSADAKEVVRMGMGLIVLIAALVLGLLIASAKSAYDTQSSQIKQMTANFILLDFVLAQYGPDAKAARDLLRRGTVVLVDRIWSEGSSGSANAAPFEATAAGNEFYATLRELAPLNDAQRALKAQAVQITGDLTRTRLLLFAETGNSIPMPFLVVLVFWLTWLRHPTTHRLAQAADLDPPRKPKHHPPDPRERRRVAGFRSEPWPASNRNGWPASDWNAWPASSESAVGASSGHIRETTWSTGPHTGEQAGE